MCTLYPGTRLKFGTPSSFSGSFWIFSKWSAMGTAFQISGFLLPPAAGGAAAAAGAGVFSSAIFSSMLVQRLSSTFELSRRRARCPSPT